MVWTVYICSFAQDIVRVKDPRGKTGGRTEAWVPGTYPRSQTMESGCGNRVFSTMTAPSAGNKAVNHVRSDYNGVCFVPVTSRVDPLPTD